MNRALEEAIIDEIIRNERPVERPGRCAGATPGRPWPGRAPESARPSPEEPRSERNLRHPGSSSHRRP